MGEKEKQKKGGDGHESRSAPSNRPSSITEWAASLPIKEEEPKFYRELRVREAMNALTPPPSPPSVQQATVNQSATTHPPPPSTHSTITIPAHLRLHLPLQVSQSLLQAPRVFRSGAWRTYVRVCPPPPPPSIYQCGGTPSGAPRRDPGRRVHYRPNTENTSIARAPRNSWQPCMSSRRLTLYK